MIECVFLGVQSSSYLINNLPLALHMVRYVTTMWRLCQMSNSIQNIIMCIVESNRKICRREQKLQCGSLIKFLKMTDVKEDYQVLIKLLEVVVRISNCVFSFKRGSTLKHPSKTSFSPSSYFLFLIAINL